MSDPPVSFNLWTEPWIRVTRPDGGEEVLSIGACLSAAQGLAALGDPSPLVVGGTHRLLAAILQAIYTPGNLGEIAALLRRGRFDQERLDAFAAAHAARFDLFHPEAPFLQTGDVPLDGWRKAEVGKKNAWADPKPMAALFAELPGETNRAHFHHVTDESHVVCPACCARGLVTIPAFASSGGAGIRPSINGVPPIYVLPLGRNLFEALACSLVSPDFQPSGADPRRAEAAAWRGPTAVGKSSAVGAVGYLESLTFPARRMRLYAQRQTGTCTHCGALAEVSVRAMLFEMGHWLSEGGGAWEDPFAGFRKPRGRSKSEDSGPRPVRPEEGKALWREYSGLLLAEREDLLRPRVVTQLAKLIESGALPEIEYARVRCIGIRTDGKAKIFEWLDEALEAPPALLNDDLAANEVDKALQRADQVRFIIESSFDGHFRPARDRGGRDAKLARFKSVRARMSADYWARLAPLFRDFIRDLAGAEGHDAIALAWGDRLVGAGRQSFDLAAEQVGGRAEALRARVEAQEACRHRLNKQRKEWFRDE